MRRLTLALGLVGLSIFGVPAVLAIDRSAVPTPAAEIGVAPVLVRLDGEDRELMRLRREALATSEVETTLRFVSVAIAHLRSTGEASWLGRAEAALARFADAPDAPTAVWLLRATLRQSRHDFSAALADLDRVLAAEPRSAQAWWTRAVVEGVRGEPADALRSCTVLLRLADPLISTTCVAQARTLLGGSEGVRDVLARALERADANATPEIVRFALGVLAEAALASGDAVAARRALTAALALPGRDVATLAAWADLALANGDASEVAARLAGEARSDALLLRLALAQRELGDEAWRRTAARLDDRLSAARLRGDAIHRREEARFALELVPDATRALAAAVASFEVQREVEDARLLLRAALAAKQPEAARPVLAWRVHTGVRDVRIDALLDRAGEKVAAQ